MSGGHGGTGNSSRGGGRAQMPRDSRLVALMLSQYAHAADPGVLAQLTEFAYRKFSIDVLVLSSG